MTRRRGQEGQSLIEFSLMLPVLLMLLLGILDFGMAFDHLLTIRYASREGARIGAALVNGGGTLGCGASQSPNQSTSARERAAGDGTFRGRCSTGNRAGGPDYSTAPEPDSRRRQRLSGAIESGSGCGQAKSTHETLMNLEAGKPSRQRRETHTQAYRRTVQLGKVLYQLAGAARNRGQRPALASIVDAARNVCFEIFHGTLET